MNQLNDIQRARLVRRGIAANDDNGPVVQCLTADGVRYYTIEDLMQMAEPGVVERLRDWIASFAKEAA